jgi:hypothetical protein
MARGHLLGIAAALLVGLVVGPGAIAAEPVDDGPGRWTVERAEAWQKAQPWLVGCNYMPSTAINQLEMFQADSFDPETIDRELGYAEDFSTAVSKFWRSLTGTISR